MKFLLVLTLYSTTAVYSTVLTVPPQKVPCQCEHGETIAFRLCPQDKPNLCYSCDVGYTLDRNTEACTDSDLVTSVQTVDDFLTTNMLSSATDYAVSSEGYIIVNNFANGSQNGFSSSVLKISGIAGQVPTYTRREGYSSWLDDAINLESLKTEAEIYVTLSAALVASYVYDDTQFQIGIATTDASRNRDYVLFKLQNLDSRHDLQNDYSIFSGITVQQESFSQDLYECKYAFDYSPSSVGKWQKIEITDRIPCNSMTSPCDSQLQDALSARNNNLQSRQTGSSLTYEYFYLDRSGPSNVGYFAHVHTCEPQWLYSNGGTSEYLKCQVIGQSDYRWSTPTQMCVENLCPEITHLPQNAVRSGANSNAYGNVVYFECQNDGTQLNVFSNNYRTMSFTCDRNSNLDGLTYNLPANFQSEKCVRCTTSYTCPRGVPVQVKPTNNFCPQEGAILCESCDTGYTNSASWRECDICDDGFELVGNICTVICQPGFRNDPNDRTNCLPNTCSCNNGVLGDQATCLNTGSQNCQSCDEGYQLEGKICQNCQNGFEFVGDTCTIICPPGFKNDPNDRTNCLPYTCSCNNGVLGDQATCLSTGSQNCKSCDEAYQLEGKTCQKISQCGMEGNPPCVLTSVTETDPNFPATNAFDNDPTTITVAANAGEAFVVNIGSSSPVAIGQVGLILDPNHTSDYKTYGIQIATSNAGRRKRRNTQTCQPLQVHLDKIDLLAANNQPLMFICPTGTVGNTINVASSDPSLKIRSGGIFFLPPTANFCENITCDADTTLGICLNTLTAFSCPCKAGFSVDPNDFTKCLREGQAIEIVDEDIQDILDNFDGKPIDQDTTEQITEKVEDIFIPEDPTTDVGAANEQQVANIQENFEKVLIRTEPNVAFVTDSLQTSVKTTNQVVKQAKNELQIDEQTREVIGDHYSYVSPAELATNTKVAIPASIVTSETGDENCSSPVAISESKNSQHLQIADKEYKKSVSTISISTCDSVKDSTQKFETPIYLQFSRPENGLNEQASDIQCAYYDTTYYRWLSLPMDNTNTNGSNVICQVDHLTYFSLLFRENDTNDDQALTILDIVFTIISMVSSVLAIYFYIARKGFNKTGANPVKRSVFHLSLHLLLMNLCFFFGQQVLYPQNYDVQGCLAVAILLQFTIVAFFLKTLFLAIVLVLGSLNKTALFKFSSFKFEVIEFFVTYFVSFLMVLIQVLVIGKSEDLGVGYLYGGIQSPHSYLNMRTTSTGSTVCFVQGYPFWFGTMLPYFLAMLTVIFTYLYQTYLICNNVSTDKMKVQQQREIMKKLIMVFFSIGVCWLFLILAIAIPSQNRALDGIFIVLKGLQGVVVLVFLNGRQLENLFNTILGKFKRDED